jgi:putative ABC transport system permease protein
MATTMLNSLLQDLRYGARMLLKHPSSTFVAVVTLALGIGANAAIFSVVNGVLLQPLPYEDPDRVVMIYRYTEGEAQPTLTISGPDFLDLKQRSQLLESVAIIHGSNASLTGDNGEPEQMASAFVSADFFSTFRVKAYLGRTFLREEAVPNGPRVVMLSHSLWQRRFGGDARLIGQTIKLSSNPFTVVGVLPPDFKLHLPPDAFMLNDAGVWLPAQVNFERVQRTNNFMTAFARLKPGVTVAQAQAEMDKLAAQLSEEHLELKNARMRTGVLPLHQGIVRHVRPALLVLLGAVGFVLLIACANAANLLLARAAARQQELAVRTALGASRWRLVRQALTESLLLACCGGALGILLAYLGLELLLALQPANLPRLENIALDERALLFCLAVCGLTPLLFGLPVALRASRGDLVAALKESSRQSASDGKRLRQLLVIGELALSLVLLIGGGLLIKTFAALQAVRLGFEPARVLTFQVMPPYSRYGALGWERNWNFYRQLEELLAALPGVEAVGITSQMPFSGEGHTGSYAWDEDSRRNRSDLIADWRFVTPNYFNVVGTKLLAGRYFTPQDDANHPWVVIVDETLARKVWPNESAVGKWLLLPNSTQRGIQRVWAEVVGVIEPVRSHKLSAHTREQFYISYAQNSAVPNMTVAVRSSADPAGLLRALKREIYAVDKEVPVYKVRMMEEYVAAALAPARFSLTLMGIFGALALVLAAIGLYGVLAYLVSQRTREIGIRMALGAQRADVLRLVLKQGLGLTLAGIATGWLAAGGLMRLLASLLYGVSANDPLTFAGVTVLLALVAFVASYVPARRATRVDPLVSLRNE